MPRKEKQPTTLTELQLQTLKEWQKYYKNPQAYARKIKTITRQYDPKARVILFGSTIKGTAKPDSDIDLLIITKLANNTNNRIKLRVEIAKQIDDNTPFQIHIITPQEYNNWYKKFINKHIEI